MKLIDKSALVAETEKQLSYYKDLEDRGIITDCGIAGYRVAKMIKSDIESLEVKEVDLDKEEERIWKDFNMSECPLSKKGLEKISKHFFELGMAVSNKAQKGE